MADHKKYFILCDKGVYAKNDKGNTIWVESFLDAYCYKNLHDAKAQCEFLKNKFPDLDVYLIGEMPEFANGGYTRPSYDMETTGDYIFQTNRGRFLVTSYLFERQNDTEDALEIQDNLRGDLGSIIIKNSAWKNLSSGKSVKARSSKGNLFGTLSRVKEETTPNNKKFAEGGLTDKDFVQKKIFTKGQTKIVLEKPNGKYYRVTYFDLESKKKLSSYGSPDLYDVIYDINSHSKKFKTGGDIRDYDWFQTFNNISPKDETFLKGVHQTLVSGMFLIQERTLTEEQAIAYIDQHFNQLLSNGRKGYSPIQALEMIESKKFMAGGRAWKKTSRTIAPSIAFNIDDKAVEKFLKKYPKVKATMSPYIYGNDVLKNYRRWLKDTDDSELGGKAEVVSSKTFGTKTYYKFDWTGVSGWAVIFQYLFDKKK